LEDISKLIDSGVLRVFVEDVFPLAKSQEAYARAQRGKMRGKVALRIAD
jgi:NADPH:quinone reductase-like Zn-dependent oxidoreductase